MINFPVDLVLPYVNSTIKSWQDNYIEFCKNNGYKERVTSFNNERFRDWGYLRYMFRGIDQNMPFIHKVFLLLQDKDQIPAWMDTNQIEIVYHKDFIPEKFLPTYNSTTIEMFLDKIPNLAEHFIYANDDLYAMNPMAAEDFYTEDGKVKIGFRQRVLHAPLMQFDVVCNNCYNMVQRKIASRDTTPNYVTPYHEFIPMIKSDVTKVNDMFRKEIEKGITPFRAPTNHNQYIYSYYELLTHNTEQPTRSYFYINMENNVEPVKKAILQGLAHTLVLNDSEKTDVKLWAANKDVMLAFDYRWPHVSRFEERLKVSICIPMYNSEEYIERCLSSLPKRKDVEIVIIDDASKDNSLKIVDSLMRGWPKFQILASRQNSGVGFARNVLIERANGKYIFFLDSDDWLITDKFIEVLDTVLNDQDVLITKYIRNDGFSGYPTILRGCFIKKDYIGNVRHDATRRCFEDVDFKARLTAAHDGKLNTEQVDAIIYHYDLPRKGSVTWEHWKERGLTGYQHGEDTWERWYKGKAR